MPQTLNRLPAHVSATQATVLLGVKQRRVRQLCESRVLEGERVGRSGWWKVSTDSICRLLGVTPDELLRRLNESKEEGVEA
jgi:hypothetical protein